eukprot:328006-Rhodomonas_salina.1
MPAVALYVSIASVYMSASRAPLLSALPRSRCHPHRRHACQHCRHACPHNGAVIHLVSMQNRVSASRHTSRHRMHVCQRCVSAPPDLCPACLLISQTSQRTAALPRSSQQNSIIINPPGAAVGAAAETPARPPTARTATRASAPHSPSSTLLLHLVRRPALLRSLRRSALASQTRRCGLRSACGSRTRRVATRSVNPRRWGATGERFGARVVRSGPRQPADS